MALRCCVDDCLTTKHPNVIFHGFPLVDPERLRQWLLALDIDVNTPLHVLSKLFVCQKHFQLNDYYDYHYPDQTVRRGRLLKTTAVPTQLNTSGTGDPTDSLIHLDQLVSHKRDENTDVFLCNAEAGHDLQ